MNYRKWTGFAAFLLLSAAFVFGKDFWESTFDKWSQKDVIKMLSESPWAINTTIASAIAGKDPDKSATDRSSDRTRGESEKYHKFTFRLFSALPVREAYVRLSRIRNNYDGMSPEQKGEFDARFNRPLKLDFSEKVIVAMEFNTSDPDVNRELKSFLATATAETLKQSVNLITKSNPRVDPIEYYPPAADGTGAKFVFPRVINGKPIVSSEDKEFRFTMWMPAGVDQQVYVDFKPSKMMYRGKLEM